MVILRGLNHSSRIDSLALSYKHIGMYKYKHTHTHTPSRTLAWVPLLPPVLRAAAGNDSVPVWLPTTLTAFWSGARLLLLSKSGCGQASHLPGSQEETHIN